MEVVPRGGPHRRLIPRRLENPEEADYTNKRMLVAGLSTETGLSPELCLSVPSRCPTIKLNVSM